VPRNNHRRVFAPILSPIRPRNAPKMKVKTEVRACWSARWKEVSRSPEGPWKRRARARASWKERQRAEKDDRVYGRLTWTVLPVWNAHHTKTAEKQITSLQRRSSERPVANLEKGRTHMKPVMKQYAASGKVDRSGSTSLMICALERMVVGEIHRAESWSCEL
jgi:hypothetical protein